MGAEREGQRTVPALETSEKPAFRQSAPAAQEERAMRWTQVLQGVAAGIIVLMVMTEGHMASASVFAPMSFADLAAQVGPAVVNIASIHHVVGGASLDQGSISTTTEV
jgi:S1-C subfamily serine protease